MDNNHLVGYQYLGFMSFIIIIINLFKKPNKNAVLLRQEAKKHKKKIKEYHRKKKQELRTEIRKMKQNNFVNDDIVDAVNVDDDIVDADDDIVDADDVDAVNVDDDIVDADDAVVKANLKATSKILSVDEKIQLLDESLWDENW